jgi:hypothetical protein
VYGAGACGASARRRAWGTEAGCGDGQGGRDVSALRGSARMSARAWAGAGGLVRGLTRGRRGGGRSIGCLPRLDPWVAGSGDGPTGPSP